MCRRGLGRATALALAAAGTDVAVTARSAELVAVAAELETLGRTVATVQADVSTRADVERLVDETRRRLGRIDILVANAGEYVRRPADKMAASDVEEVLVGNLQTTLHPVLAVLPEMLERGSEHLGLVGSVNGRRTLPGDLPYAVAKFGVTALAQGLRQELRSRGVGVTGVYPAAVDTRMLASLAVPWLTPKLPPERVARAIVTASRRNRAEVVLPRRVRALLLADLASARLADRLIELLGLRARPAGEIE